ncbi:MAG: hypothetical protein ABIH65_03775 [Nanoarchaeota archaeon]
MNFDEYNKVLERYKTAAFVGIVIFTIIYVYNQLVLNNESIKLIVYAGLIGYAISIIVCGIILKKVVSVKKK